MIYFNNNKAASSGDKEKEIQNAFLKPQDGLSCKQ